MPVGIRPSLTPTPRAGRHPHAHKIQGGILGHAHLGTEVVGTALDGSLGTASDLSLVHERGRLVRLRGQVTVDPGVAVLGFLRACARENDAIQDTTLAGLEHVLVSGVRAASFHGGTAPVEMNTDAGLGDDVNLGFEGQEALFGVLLGHVLVAVLDDQACPAPVPRGQLGERTLEGILLGQARGSRVQLHAGDQLSSRAIAQGGQVLAQRPGEVESGGSSGLVGRGQAEILILPHVLHGAGNRGDRIEFPVGGQVTGQDLTLGGELPRVGHFDAADPRPIREEAVVVSLQLRRRMRRVRADNERKCHGDHPSLMMSSFPSSGRTYSGPTAFCSRRGTFAPMDTMTIAANPKDKIARAIPRPS